MSNTTDNETDKQAAGSVTRLVRRLKARAVIAGDLYREGRITRAECFRLEGDAAHAEDSGPIQFEDNDDHEFMMTGVGADHDEYRSRMANR